MRVLVRRAGVAVFALGLVFLSAALLPPAGLMLLRPAVAAQLPAGIDGQTEESRPVVPAIEYPSKLLLSASRTVLAKYGDSAILLGRLHQESMDGPALAGRVVELQHYRSGQWNVIQTAVTSSSGKVSYAITPRKATTYRLVFAGTRGEYTASRSEKVRITPRVFLSAPKAPTAMSRSWNYTIGGTLKPRHTPGSGAVRIYRWHKTASGDWKSYGYVTAAITDHMSYSAYSTKLRLPNRGAWKIQAYHPADSAHAATWSAPIEVQVCGSMPIALTFDDGPHPLDTPEVLSALKQYNARATFFLLGARVVRYPATVRQIATDGHQLGNHRYTHKIRSTEMSISDFRNEVIATNEAIRSALTMDSKPVKTRYPIVFRYPWGVGDARTHAVLANLGMRHYRWSYGPGDGGSQGALSAYITDVIARRVIDNAQPQSIIVMHDSPNQPNTVAAVPIILEELSEQGYDFVTVEDLRKLRQEPTTLSLSVPSSVTYDTGVEVKGRLVTTSGRSLAEQSVRLQVSKDGKTWTNRNTVMTDSKGRYVAATGKLKTARHIRVRFSGTSVLAPVTSAKLSVKPKILFSDAPRMTTYTHTLGKTHSVWGHIKPKHTAGSTQIKVYAYRYERKADGTMGYVYKKSYSTKISNPSGSAYSKYKGSVKLPSKGKWRLRAYHAEDSKNAKSYSPYRYVTVK